MVINQLESSISEKTEQPTVTSVIERSSKIRVDNLLLVQAKSIYLVTLLR